MTRDGSHGQPDDPAARLDPAAWDDADVRCPDLTMSILSRVERVRPFVSARGQRMAQVGRLVIGAGVLAAALGVLAAHVRYASLTERPADRPVSTLVAGVATQAELATTNWWADLERPAVAPEPDGQARAMRTVLAALRLPVIEPSDASEARTRPNVERWRAEDLVARAGQWVWRSGPATPTRGAQAVSLADQVSGVVAGRPGQAINPD